MNNKPLVSVVMPLYNAGRYLEDALDSVYAQTYENLEVIAVNDGSIDDTATRIQAYLGRPGFRYLEQINKGVSAARNLGLRAATGDLIAFLDHDDRWLSDKLEKQVAYLLANPDIGLVHGNIQFMDESGRPLPREVSNFKTDASGWCFRTLFEDNKIATLTVCMRRECFLKVGYLREDIRGGEDYEYWLRIAWDYPIGHIDEDMAVYRLHEENATKNWLPHLVDLAKALEGILTRFPEARKALGTAVIRIRLLPIYLRISREFYRQNEHDLARLHLLSALALKPLCLECIRMIAIGYLPPSIRRGLRWYLRKFTK